MDAEVIVVGLGSTGAMALWRLAGRGVSAIGVDRFRPPHRFGSHTGESRIIRTAYYEAPEYVPLARSSFALWRELERESGRRLLTVTGGLYMGAPDSPEVSGALLSARRHDLPHELLDSAAAGRRFPQHRLAEGEVALVEKEAGYLLPEECIAAGLERAAALGARIELETPVEAVELTGEGVTVRAAGRSWRARRAVVAAGAWNSGLGVPGLQVLLRVVRQAQAWFRVGRPELHDPAVAPVFIRHLAGAKPAGDEFAYGFPAIDGETVKVGVAEDRGEVDPDTMDRTPVPADWSAVAAFVRRTMPDLDPEPVRVAVCLQEFSPDHHFLVGPLPAAPAIVVLMGFSGHGFKFASAIGEAAAGFATEGGTGLAVGHLSAGRFAEART
ncbi:MAG TPA: N-methyl-L-tryptophan oxidase [Candidatus Dormibacteraeota bacterium]|nr:N-methyl-L-tryptophan oxidase [Candidatus Dormibacteraeota bacterium]